VFEDVTVNVNGDLFDTAGSGDVVNVPVVNSEDSPIGTIAAGKVTVASGDLSLNGTDVDTLLPSANKALTTTLDNVPVAATYTAGVININNPAPSGYAGRILGLPQQVVQINAGDCGWGLSQGAFNFNIPRTAIGFYTLNASDPTGSTLNELNRFGNYARFTNLTGTADATQTVDIVGGDAVTRTAEAFIDHLQNITIFYVATTGNWATQCARANGASCDGMAVYFASVDISTQLYTYQSGILSHLQRLGITIPAVGIFTGEAVAGTTNIYCINASGVVISTLTQAGNRSALLFKKDVIW